STQEGLRTMTTEERRAVHSPTPLLAASVTTGFAIAVFAATVGFFTHLPGLRAPSPVVFFLLAAAILAVAAFCASRVARRRAPLVGALGGFVGGIVLLMMLGSLLVADDGSGSIRDNAPVI